MTVENKVGFLYSVASSLSPYNESLKWLRSYYLMQCHELTHGIGLPKKQFSTVVRCPHCYLEWTKDTMVKLQPVKLSRRRRQNLRKKKDTIKSNGQKVACSLRNNEMEQICTHCKQATKTILEKPETKFIKPATIENPTILKPIQNKNTSNSKPNAALKKFGPETVKAEKKYSSIVNVYSNALDVFSLKNEKNTLLNTIKTSKVIKNNKKKKDKFAGLCQKAVLASTKLKEQKDKEKPNSQNKLNLFLKPSS